MGEHNSPTFDHGVDDGLRDKDAVESCPMGFPVGPQPPFPAYPVMYLRGYHSAFDDAVPHGSCKKCRPDLHSREA